MTEQANTGATGRVGDQKRGTTAVDHTDPGAVAEGQIGEGAAFGWGPGGHDVPVQPGGLVAKPHAQ